MNHFRIETESCNEYVTITIWVSVSKVTHENKIGTRSGRLILSTLCRSEFPAENHGAEVAAIVHDLDLAT